MHLVTGPPPRPSHTSARPLPQAQTAADGRQRLQLRIPGPQHPPLVLLPHAPVQRRAVRAPHPPPGAPRLRPVLLHRRHGEQAPAAPLWGPLQDRRHADRHPPRRGRPGLGSPVVLQHFLRRYGTAPLPHPHPPPSCGPAVIACDTQPDPWLRPCATFHFSRAQPCIQFFLDYKA